MAIRGERTFTWSFDEIALNLADSSRHLKPDEAVIVQDIDFDDKRGGVTGRYGTKTINVAADGTPDPLAAYQFKDLFRATDTDTNKKYVIGVYDDLSNYKIGALCTTDGDKAFTTLQQGGGDFTITRGARVSFSNVREPGIDDVIVMGTNGIDNPFYFKGTGGVTDFTFGTSEFKLKYLLERPFQGHQFAALRNVAGETTMVHWSETTNFLSFVETEGTGFRQCPPDDLLNAFRGFRILNNKLSIFNLDSIGELFYTGNSASPFRFREIVRDNGAVHNNAIAQYGNTIWFLDKRAPYLKYWNGYNVGVPKNADTIATGLEKWLDLSDALNVRMTAGNGKLFISFKAAPTYAATGTDGKRWLAVISLNKTDRNNMPYHPMSLWKIRASDIIHVDEGTDFGQIYFADAAAQNIGGTDYYFLRRICDWYDFRTSELTALGDGNGITGTDATDVDNILQTGWMSLPGDQWFRALYMSIDGEWDGTPSANTTLALKYRFEGWSSFATMIVSAVDGVARFPFAANAQGRRMQLRFEYSDNQSRPVLHRIKLWYRPKPGVRAA